MVADMKESINYIGWYFSFIFTTLLNAKYFFDICRSSS